MRLNVPAFMQELEAQEQPRTVPSVPVDDSQRQCALSGERFETVWDAESEDWHYLGAVRLSGEEAARCDSLPEIPADLVLGWKLHMCTGLACLHALVSRDFCCRHSVTGRLSVPSSHHFSSKQQ